MVEVEEGTRVFKITDFMRTTRIDTYRYNKVKKLENISIEIVIMNLLDGR